VVLVWIAFISLILFLLALDLGIFHRTAHVVSVREALGWSIAWFVLAIAFGGFVYAAYEYKWFGLGLAADLAGRSHLHPDGVINDGQSALLKYLTGYVVEESLSVDNMFVIAMLFRAFAIPSIYQHRVLFWGILGALVMRGAMIALGARLVTEFSWILYVFGVFLIATAVKMLLVKDEAVTPGDNGLVRLVRRWMPITDRLHGERFIVRDPRLMLTPLAMALLMVEATDLLFAVDSIPAIFAITTDPFLVFASNVFAILGLRSLYFVLAGALEAFHYLKVSLALVLGLVGTKMLAHEWLEQRLGEYFNLYLLGAILGILAGGIIASALWRRRAPSTPVPQPPGPATPDAPPSADRSPGR
jgi:tellurite resistance protein TerC